MTARPEALSPAPGEYFPVYDFRWNTAEIEGAVKITDRIATGMDGKLNAKSRPPAISIISEIREMALSAENETTRGTKDEANPFTPPSFFLISALS